MPLGDRLREAREHYGFSQAQAAQAVGVSRSSYSMYELAERDPDSQVLIKLGRLYSVSSDWLLGRTDDPTPPEEKLPLEPDTLLDRAGELMALVPGIERADVEEVVQYLRTKRRLRLAGSGQRPTAKTTPGSAE